MNEEKKHICIVTRNLRAGGAERVIAHLCRFLIDNGHTVTLILLEEAEIQYELPPGVHIRTIGRQSRGALADKLRSYRAVRKAVLAAAPDAVLAMPEEIGIYVLLALSGTHIRTVVSERNNPYVYPPRKITRLLRRIAYPMADGLIFQTEGAAAFFPARIRKKSIVLPNPLDAARLPLPFCGEREKVIVGAGRLEAQKNFPLLLAAFALFYRTHPDFQLVIYGEGSRRAELEEAALQSGLPAGSVLFPGHVPDLPCRINSATAFVLSSDYEGMPNVLIEAMACGVPSVATDCPPGGAAALIDSGKNGVLCPVGDAQALANALCRIAEDPGFARALSQNSIQLRNTLEMSRICTKWFLFLTGSPVSN